MTAQPVERMLDLMTAHAMKLEAAVKCRDELLRCWWADCGVEDEDKAERYMVETRDLIGWKNP